MKNLRSKLKRKSSGGFLSRIRAPFPSLHNKVANIPIAQSLVNTYRKDGADGTGMGGVSAADGQGGNNENEEGFSNFDENHAGPGRGGRGNQQLHDSGSWSGDQFRESQNIFYNDEIEPSELDLAKYKLGTPRLIHGIGTGILGGNYGGAAGNQVKNRPGAGNAMREEKKTPEDKRSVRLTYEEDYVREEERRLVRVARLANRASRGSSDATAAMCTLLLQQISAVETHVSRVRSTLYDSVKIVHSLPEKAQPAPIPRFNSNSSESGRGMRNSSSGIHTGRHFVSNLEEDESMFWKRLGFERKLWEMESMMREGRLHAAVCMAEELRKSKSFGEDVDNNQRLEVLIHTLADLIVRRAQQRIDQMATGKHVVTSADSLIIQDASLLMRLVQVKIARDLVLQNASARIKYFLGEEEKRATSQKNANFLASTFEMLLYQLTCVLLEIQTVLRSEGARESAQIMFSNAPIAVQTENSISTAEEAAQAADSCWELFLFIVYLVDTALGTYVIPKLNTPTRNIRLFISCLTQYHEALAAMRQPQKLAERFEGWNSRARDDAVSQIALIFESRLMRHLDEFFVESFDRECSRMVENATKCIKEDEGEFRQISTLELCSGLSGKQDERIRVSSSCISISQSLWKFIEVVNPILTDPVFYSPIISCLCRSLQAYLSYVGQSRLKDSVVKTNLLAMANHTVPRLVEMLASNMDYPVLDLILVQNALNKRVGVRPSEEERLVVETMVSAGGGVGVGMAAGIGSTLATPSGVAASASAVPGGGASMGSVVVPSIHSPVIGPNGGNGANQFAGARTGASSISILENIFSLAPSAVGDFRGLNASPLTSLNSASGGPYARPGSGNSNDSRGNKDRPALPSRPSASPKQPEFQSRQSKDSLTDPSHPPAPLAGTITSAPKHLGSVDGGLRVDIIRNKLQRHRSSDPAIK